MNVISTQNDIIMAVPFIGGVTGRKPLTCCTTLRHRQHIWFRITVLSNNLSLTSKNRIFPFTGVL